MKKKVKIIVGLKEWGKTFCLKKTIGFDVKNRLITKRNNNFRTIFIEKLDKWVFVLNNSNCDIGLEKYLKDVKKILNQLKEAEEVDTALITFCSQNKREVIEILKVLKEFNFSYEVVWLENHWDDVAKLNIDELEKLFQKYIKFEDITKKYNIKSSNDCKENIVV